MMLAPNLQMFWRNEEFRLRESRVISIASKSDESVIDRRLVEQGVVLGGLAKDRVIDRLIVSPDLRYSSIKGG
ncbi:unnamed protein product [Caenorhabditis angaria]|uniref:Uncharacterized protein n=1 Tax=Caenorhabditis angaria TaxID=860376 RepID=A0A9P1I9M5_9PELO|nr:unnamed protein product [Caenorhabditis angaria]